MTNRARWPRMADDTWRVSLTELIEARPGLAELAAVGARVVAAAMEGA